MAASAVRTWRPLVANGLPAGDETREDCCYALRDKFWLADPDGNR